MAASLGMLGSMGPGSNASPSSGSTGLGSTSSSEETSMTSDTSSSEGIPRARLGAREAREASRREELRLATALPGVKAGRQHHTRLGTR